MSTAHTPTVGVVYGFTFNAGYDAFNGIYKLTKLVTYDQYLEESGNLLTDFYEPNGLEQTDLDRDLPTIRESKIMQLSPPDSLSTEAAKYAPLCFLETTPDHHVDKYYKFGIISQIGITANPAELDFMRQAIIEHVEAATGITPDPKLVTLSETWMTESQYADEIAKRDEAKKKLVNYYSENQRLQAQLRDVQTILKDYEATIIKQQRQLEEVDDILASTPLSTISFNANGGAGAMTTIRRYKGSSYSIPECEFTPPEEQTFKCWCDQPTTDSPDVHVFNVGDSIALNDYADAILLYAIWVDATPPEDETA